MTKTLSPAALCLLAALLAGRASAGTVVSLTFDDGWASQSLARDILDARGLKGTFYVSSQRMLQPGTYLTTDQLMSMQANGHEIGGHTWDHVDLSGLSTSQLQHEICDDRAALQALGLNAVSLAYPFGDDGSAVQSMTRSCGYTSGRTVGGLGCSGCDAAETIPPDNAFTLRTPNSIKSDTTLDTMKRYVTNAEQAGGAWVPLVMHQVCDGCDAYSVSTGTLSAFLDWLMPRASSGTVVRTVAQVMGGGGGPVLTLLSPSSVLAGSPDLAVEARGSGFTSSSTVRWNGSDRPTTFMSSLVLRAVIPAGDLASPGTASVTVFDPSGGGGGSNALPFTVNSVQPPSSSTTTIFTSQAPGAYDYALDSNPAEVGLRFRSDSAGYITGIRCYKPAQVAGTRIGHLWTNAGVLLGTAPFSGEASSGWQTAYFSTSIAVQAGVTYMASYHDTQGYAVTTNYFANAGVDNPPLHALQSGVDGLNGTYRYGATAIFPNQSTRTSNYWVDVVYASTGAASNPVPVLSSVSPSSAAAGGPGFTLAVTGSGFVNSSTVRWNGVDRTTSFISSSALTAAILAGDIASSGTASVTVFSPGPGGGISTPIAFPVYFSNPVPQLASVAPSSAAAGGPGFTLSVYGSGFVSSSTVRWNGTDRVTSYISSTSLTASILAGDIASSGTANVTVFSPGPGGGISTPMGFSIYAPNPLPQLAAVSPSSAAAGGPGFTLAVAGSGFVNSSTVRWNGVDRTTSYISSTSLTAAILADDIASSGTASVTVFSPGPGGGTSTPVAFQIYFSNPVPQLASVSPSSAAAGGPGLTLAVMGSGFVNSSTVRWNGVDRATSYISSTALTAAILAGDIVSSGTANVTVFSPGPGGGTSTPVAFPIYFSNPLPQLASVSPSSAAAGGADFTLSVYGSGFVSSSTIRWNGVDRTTSYISSSALAAAILAGDIASSGTANVTVFSPGPGGGISTPMGFSIYVPNPLPQLAAVSPSSAAAGGPGFTLAVMGSGFVNSSTVRWNGTDRTTSYISSTSLSAAILAADIASSGTANVTVFSPGPGGGTSTPVAFQIYFSNPVPQLASVSPSSAAAGGPGLTLAVMGSGFVNSSTVRWNGADRTTSFISSSALTAAILAGDIASSGTASVTVFSPGPGGGASTSAVFTILATVPASTRTVVSLTFDDGSSDHPLAGQILAQRGLKGTFYINSAELGTSGWYMTLSDVRSLQASGHEIGGHTLEHVDLIGLSDADLRHQICDDRSNLLVWGSTAASFAYPNGHYDARSEAMVQTCGYSSGRGTAGIACPGCPKAEMVPPLDAFATRAPESIVWGMTLSDLEKYVTDAEQAGGGWVQLIFHRICEGCDTYAVSASTLAALADWLQARAPTGTIVRTVGEVMGQGAAGNPVPTVAAISPSSAAAGGPGFTLSVYGSGFISSSTVRWNGADRATSFISSAALTAAVPAGDIASSGTASVTVFSPGPGGGVSSPTFFTMLSSAPAGLPVYYALWSTSTVPADGYKDPNPAEMGVRIRSDIPGFILGVRFHKRSTNTGTHVGHLWTNQGAKLAEVSFTGETASGWQTAWFAAPVPVSAGVTYVASYFSTTGYSVDRDYFTKPYDHAPLHALQSGTDGLNGVYIYASTGAFPNRSTRSSNYWVDVVFSTSAGGFGGGLFAAAAPGVEAGRVQPPGHSAAFADASLARVRPNPWRADRHAGTKLVFDQLPPDSTVRIFTLSAHAVKTLDAPGGTASWDLTNESGDPVASGFYLYLATDPRNERKRGIVGVIR